MRIGYFGSDKEKEQAVLDAFAAGVRECGDEAIEGARTIPEGVDAVLIFGIKSLRLWNEAQARGVRVLYADKGYTRQRQGWRYIRFSWDATQPLEYVKTATRGPERWHRVGKKLPLAPWRPNRARAQIVVAGSSEKYHKWHDLVDPQTYARHIIETLEPLGRPIIYRPKPSWKGAQPIPGSMFSSKRGMLQRDLVGAHCLVTHGSNACVDAVVAGVPVVALGPAVVRSVCSTDLLDAKNPRMCSTEERLQLLSNVAWCQWSMRELVSGHAWENIKEQGKCT